MTAVTVFTVITLHGYTYKQSYKLRQVEAVSVQN